MKGQPCAASERARHRKALLSRNTHHRKQKWNILGSGSNNGKKTRYIAVSKVLAGGVQQCQNQTLENINNSQNDDNTMEVKDEGDRNSSAGFFDSFARAFSGEMENFYGMDTADLTTGEPPPPPPPMQTEAPVQTQLIIELNQNLSPQVMVVSNDPEKEKNYTEPSTLPIVTEQLQQFDASTSELKVEPMCMRSPVRMPTVIKEDTTTVNFLNANFFTNFKQSKVNTKPCKGKMSSRVPYVSTSKPTRKTKSFKEYLLTAGKQQTESESPTNTKEDLDSTVVLVDTVTQNDERGTSVDSRIFTFPDVSKLVAPNDHVLNMPAALDDAKERALQEANKFEIAKDFALLEASELELAKDQALLEADKLKVASNHALQEANQLQVAKESMLKEATKFEIAKEHALQKATQFEVAKDFASKSPPRCPAMTEPSKNKETVILNSGDKTNESIQTTMKSTDKGIDVNVDGKDDIKIAAVKIDCHKEVKHGQVENQEKNENIITISTDIKDQEVKEQPKAESQTAVTNETKVFDDLVERRVEELLKPIMGSEKQTPVTGRDKVTVANNDGIGKEPVAKSPSENQEQKTSELMTNVESIKLETTPGKKVEAFKFEPVIDINSKPEIPKVSQVPIIENADEFCIFTSNDPSNQPQPDASWEDNDDFDTCEIRNRKRNNLPNTKIKLTNRQASSLLRKFNRKPITENVSTTENIAMTENIATIENNMSRSENDYYYDPITSTSEEPIYECGTDQMNPINLPEGENFWTDLDSCDQEYTVDFYHDDDGVHQPIYSPVPNDDNALLMEYFATMEKDPVSNEQQISMESVEQILPRNNVDSVKYPDTILGAIQAYNGLTAVYLNNKNKEKQGSKNSNNPRFQKRKERVVSMSNRANGGKSMSEICKPMSFYNLLKRPNKDNFCSHSCTKKPAMDHCINTASEILSEDSTFFPTILESSPKVSLNTESLKIKDQFSTDHKMKNVGDSVNITAHSQPILEDIIFGNGPSDSKGMDDNAVFDVITSIFEIEKDSTSEYSNKRVSLPSKYNEIPIGKKSRKVLTTRSRLRYRNVLKPTTKTVSFLRSIQRKLSPKSLNLSPTRMSSRCYNTLNPETEQKKNNSFAFHDHNPDGGICLASPDRRNFERCEAESKDPSIVASFNALFSGLSGGETLEESKLQLKDAMGDDLFENNLSPPSSQQSLHKHHTFYRLNTAAKEKKFQLKRGNGMIKKVQYKSPYVSKKRATNINTGAFLNMIQRKRIEVEPEKNIIDESSVIVGKRLVIEEDSVESLPVYLKSPDSSSLSVTLGKDMKNDKTDKKGNNKGKLALVLSKPEDIREQGNDLKSDLIVGGKSKPFSIVKAPNDTLIGFSELDSEDHHHFGTRPPKVNFNSIHECGNQAWGNIFTDDAEFYQADDDDTADEIVEKGVNNTTETETKEAAESLFPELGDMVVPTPMFVEKIIEDNITASPMVEGHAIKDIITFTPTASKTVRSVPMESFLKSTKRVESPQPPTPKNQKAVANAQIGSKNKNSKTKAKVSGIKASTFLKNLREKVDKTAGLKIHISHGVYGKGPLSPTARRKHSSKPYSPTSSAHTSPKMLKERASQKMSTTDISPKMSTGPAEIKADQSSVLPDTKTDSPKISKAEDWITAFKNTIYDLKSSGKASDVEIKSPPATSPPITKKSPAKKMTSPSTSPITSPSMKKKSPSKNVSKKTSVKSPTNFDGNEIKPVKSSENTVVMEKKETPKMHSFATGIVSRKPVLKSKSFEKGDDNSDSKSPRIQIFDTLEHKNDKKSQKPNKTKPEIPDGKEIRDKKMDYTVSQESPNMSLSSIRSISKKYSTGSKNKNKKHSSSFVKTLTQSNDQQDNKEIDGKRSFYDLSKSSSIHKKRNNEKFSSAEYSVTPSPKMSDFSFEQNSTKVTDNFEKKSPKASNSFWGKSKTHDSNEENSSQTSSNFRNNISNRLGSFSKNSPKVSGSFGKKSPKVSGSFSKNSPKIPYISGRKSENNRKPSSNTLDSLGRKASDMSDDLEQSAYPQFDDYERRDSKRNLSQISDNLEQNTHSQIDDHDKKNSKKSESWMDLFFGKSEQDSSSASALADIFQNMSTTDSTNYDKMPKGGSSSTFYNKGIKIKKTKRTSKKLSKKSGSANKLSSFVKALNNIDRQEKVSIDNYVTRTSSDKEHAPKPEKLKQKRRNPYSFKISSTDGDTFEIKQSILDNGESEKELLTKSSSPPSPGIFERTIASIFETFDNISSPFQYIIDNSEDSKEGEMKSFDEDQGKESPIYSHGIREKEPRKKSPQRVGAARKGSPYSSGRNVVKKSNSFGSMYRSKSFERGRKLSPDVNNVKTQKPQVYKPKFSVDQRRNRSASLERRRNKQVIAKHSTAKKKPIYEFDKFGRRVFVDNGRSKKKVPIVSRSLDGLGSKKHKKADNKISRDKSFNRVKRKSSEIKISKSPMLGKQPAQKIVTAAKNVEMKSIPKWKDRQTLSAKQNVGKVATMNSSNTVKETPSKEVGRKEITSPQKQTPKVITATKTHEEQSHKPMTTAKTQDEHTHKPKTKPKVQDEHIHKTIMATNPQDQQTHTAITTTKAQDQHAHTAQIAPKSQDQHTHTPITTTKPEDNKEDTQTKQHEEKETASMYTPESSSNEKSYHKDEHSTSLYTEDNIYADEGGNDDRKISTWKELFDCSPKKSVGPSFPSEDKSEGSSATNPKRYVSTSSLSKEAATNKSLQRSTPKGGSSRTSSISRRRRNMRRNVPTSYKMSGKNLVKIAPPEPTIVDHMKEAVSNFLIDWKQRNDECHVYHAENRDNNVLNSSTVTDAVSKDAVERGTRYQSPSPPRFPTPPRATHPVSQSTQDDRIETQLCSTQQAVAKCNNFVISPEMLYRDAGLSPKLQFPDTFASHTSQTPIDTPVDSTPTDSNMRIDDISLGSELQPEIVFQQESSSIRLAQTPLCYEPVEQRGKLESVVPSSICLEQTPSFYEPTEQNGKPESVVLDLAEASYHNIGSLSMPDITRPLPDFGLKMEESEFSFTEQEERKVPCLIEEQVVMNKIEIEPTVIPPTVQEFDMRLNGPSMVELDSQPSDSRLQEQNFERKSSPKYNVSQVKADEDTKHFQEQPPVVDTIKNESFSVFLSPLMEMSETNERSVCSSSNVDSVSPLFKAQGEQQSSRISPNVTPESNFSLDAMKEQLQAVVTMKGHEQNNVVEMSENVVVKPSSVIRESCVDAEIYNSDVCVPGNLVVEKASAVVCVSGVPAEKQSSVVCMSDLVVDKPSVVVCVPNLVNAQVVQDVVTHIDQHQLLDTPPKLTPTVVVGETTKMQINSESVENVLDTSSSMSLSLSQKVEKNDKSVSEAPSKVSSSSSTSSHEQLLSAALEHLNSDINAHEISLISEVKKSIIERALRVCSDSRLLKQNTEDSSSEASLASRREPIVPTVEGDPSTVDFDSSNKFTTTTSKSTFKADTETIGYIKQTPMSNTRFIIDTPNPEELSRTTVSEIFYGFHRSKIDKEESPPHHRFRSSCFTPFYGYQRPRSQKRQQMPERRDSTSTPWVKAYQKNSVTKQKRSVHRNTTSNKTLSEQSLDIADSKRRTNRTCNKDDHLLRSLTGSSTSSLTSSSFSSTKYPTKRSFKSMDHQIRSALELEDKIIKNLGMGTRCVSPTY